MKESNNIEEMREEAIYWKFPTMMQRMKLNGWTFKETIREYKIAIKWYNKQRYVL